MWPWGSSPTEDAGYGYGAGNGRLGGSVQRRRRRSSRRPTARRDIAPLVRSFSATSSRVLGKSRAPEASAATLAVLESYEWPGNIRELRNVVDRAVLLCDGATIEPSHLPAKLSARATPSMRPAGSALTNASNPVSSDPRAQLLGELERLDRDRITDALSRCGGNQTAAAELLGISRRTLVTRLHAYDLPRPRKRS